MGPLLVLVSPCFKENVVLTYKIGSFLCSLHNLLQKNVIVFFFGNQILKWHSSEERVPTFRKFTRYSVVWVWVWASSGTPPRIQMWVPPGPHKRCIPILHFISSLTPSWHYYMRGFRRGHSRPVPPPLLVAPQFFFRKERKRKERKEGRERREEKKEKKGIEKMESHAWTKKVKSSALINLQPVPHRAGVDTGGRRASPSPSKRGEKRNTDSQKWNGKKKKKEWCFVWILKWPRGGGVRDPRFVFRAFYYFRLRFFHRYFF